MNEQVSNQNNQSLAIKTSEGIHLLFKQEVLFITHLNRQTIIVTAKDQFVVSTPLYKLEQMLGDYFIRTHRSYLVNIQQIATIKRDNHRKGYIISFRHSDKVALVGVSYYADLLKRLEQFLWINHGELSKQEFPQQD